MKLEDVKPTNRRMLRRPGLLFSFPCQDFNAVGVVCTKGTMFYVAFFDRLLENSGLGDLSYFLDGSSAFIGFWTTDALFYHNRWIPRGYVSLDEIPISRSDDVVGSVLMNLKERVVQEERVQIVHRTGVTPALVEIYVCEYFSGSISGDLKKYLFVAP